ncbi:MAG TPA: helix-hairpin-helix domain-containing protein [Kiritimatiellia bacterium]|nr:helix-hairpin-helix domain-containing protein [Kiritimatiellia bacterium]
MKASVTWAVAGLILWANLLFASEWTRLDNVVWVDDPRNDADSFLVRHGDDELHVRLYFVDAPEETAHNHYVYRRIWEQARYFGLPSVDPVTRFGKMASDRARELLSEPFTVYTLYSRAPGGRESERYYGVVYLSDGRDLGKVLVAEGLARVFGVQRSYPDGRDATRVSEELNDLQLMAIMKRVGVWSKTDPDLIPALRAEQRHRNTQDRIDHLLRMEILAGGVNVNSAPLSELIALPGVGEYVARGILEKRPFKSLEEMKDVPGIGPSTLERIRPYVNFDS